MGFDACVTLRHSTVPVRHIASRRVALRCTPLRSVACQLLSRCKAVVRHLSASAADIPRTSPDLGLSVTLAPLLNRAFTR